jgi:hypothetical protein
MNNETQQDAEQNVGAHTEETEIDAIAAAVQVRAGIRAGRQLVPCQ